MTSTIKEHLIAARALIDTPEKWGKGDWRNPDGCLCVLGAVNFAGTGFVDRVDSRVERELEMVLPESFQEAPGNLRLVPRFNDHPDTTHADIMALFDRAIAAQEPSHAG